MYSLNNHPHLAKPSQKIHQRFPDKYFKLQEKLIELGWFCGWGMDGDREILNGVSYVHEMARANKVDLDKILYTKDYIIKVEDPIITGDYPEEFKEEWNDVLFDTEYNLHDQKVKQFFKNHRIYNPYENKQWTGDLLWSPDEIGECDFFYTSQNEVNQIIPIIETYEIKYRFAFDWEKKLIMNWE